MQKINKIIVWIIININNNTIHLEGVDNFQFSKSNYFYYCKYKDKKYFPTTYYERSYYDFYTMYGLIEKGRMVVFDIPLGIINSTNSLEFYISFKDVSTEIFPYLKKFTHIPMVKDGYYVSQNIIIKNIHKRLTIFKYRKKKEKKFEKLFCEELKLNNKEHLIKQRTKIKEDKYRYINYTRKQIWLINDRRDRAGDNGEFFFRYIKSKKLRGIKAYFVIEKNSSDYNRLKKLGDVLDIDSDKYLYKFLNADKIITSISMNWATNPFYEDEKYMKDLFHFDIVFLQHGITQNDVSMNLNRLIKNYSLFVTATKKEYKSILSKNYGYYPNNIILTGFPRYDYC